MNIEQINQLLTKAQLVNPLVIGVIGRLLLDSLQSHYFRKQQRMNSDTASLSKERGGREVSSLYTKQNTIARIRLSQRAPRQDGTGAAVVGDDGQAAIGVAAALCGSADGD